MMKIFKRQKGFTLIELMVAISIVAILATVGATLFANSQKTGRDGKRRGDVDALATNLESRWNVPAPNGCAGGAYCAPLGTWFAGGAVPLDPLNNGQYVYTGLPVNGAASYTLCARLENNGGNASDTSGTPASGNAATYYCRKNQQQ